jgi:putative Mg2+ transporter-C (MgtC) family protein
MFAHAWEITTNLAAAWAAGSLIGIERSYNGRAAGFRTHALVGLAAAAAMTIAFQPIVQAGVFPHGTPPFDPTRIAQGVMTGVGFLGAGVIFKEGVSVQGLTTAACIWITSAIGILFGLGMFFGGVVATAATLVTLIGFRWLERATAGHVFALAIFRFHAADAPSEQALHALLGEHDAQFHDVSYKLSQGGEIFEYRGDLKTRRAGGFPRLASRLRELPGLVEYELERISK